MVAAGQLCIASPWAERRAPTDRLHPTCATHRTTHACTPVAGVRVIAEPGRFFAETIATMGCMVYGRRVRVEPGALAGAEMPAVSWMLGGGSCTWEWWVKIVATCNWSAWRAGAGMPAATAPEQALASACMTLHRCPTCCLPSPLQARAHGALPMRKRVHSCRRLAAFCEELAAADEEHVLGYDYWVRKEFGLG